MSIMSELQATVLAGLRRAIVETPAPTPVDPTAHTQSVKDAAKTAVENAVESTIAAVVPAVTSAAISSVVSPADVVKLFTAVQAVILAFEEVKADMQANNPQVWGEITSAFPALAKTTTVITG